MYKLQYNPEFHKTLMIMKNFSHISYMHIDNMPMPYHQQFAGNE